MKKVLYLATTLLLLSCSANKKSFDIKAEMERNAIAFLSDVAKTESTPVVVTDVSIRNYDSITKKDVMAMRLVFETDAGEKIMAKLDKSIKTYKEWSNLGADDETLSFYKNEVEESKAELEKSMNVVKKTQHRMAHTDSTRYDYYLANVNVEIEQSGKVEKNIVPLVFDKKGRVIDATKM